MTAHREPQNTVHLGRRDFIKRTAVVLVGAGSLGALLAACGGAAGPTPSSSAPPSAGAKASSSQTSAAVSGQPSAAAAAKSSPPPLNPTVKVNLALVGLAAEAGFYIAMDRGYFKDEGIDVKQSRMSGTTQIPLLASGQLDFGTAAPNAGLFNAIGRGLALKIVAPSALLLPGTHNGACIMRQDYIDSGRYKEPKDLKGMTVAIQDRGNTNEMALETFLAKGGLTEADITLKTLPFPDQYTAITNRAVDAAWSTDPFVTMARDKKIAQPIVWNSEMWPGGVIQALLLGPKFAQQNPEAANRFVTAHLRGQRDFYNVTAKNQGSKEDIVRILNKYLPVKDPTLYEHIYLGGVDPNGNISLQPLNEAQDYFIKKGAQQKRLDLTKVVDGSYIKYAIDRLGTVNA